MAKVENVSKNLELIKKIAAELRVDTAFIDKEQKQQ
jgi:hypothetical protein